MLTFELLKHDDGPAYTSVYRTRIPGGWLVVVGHPNGSGATFVPDLDHSWDGSSLPPGR